MLLLFLLLIVGSTTLSAITDLQVFVTANRFQKVKGATDFEINYEVPYNELQFAERSSHLFAELSVFVEVLQDTTVLAKQHFTNNIGVRSQSDALSNKKSYRDKIVLSLKKNNFTVRITFSDPKTQKQFVWQYLAKQLSNDVLVSDMELSSSVKADSTKFMEKFHRNKNLYYVEPSLVFGKNSENIVAFYDMYATVADSASKAVAKEVLSMQQEGKEVFRQEFEEFVTAQINNRTRSIPIGNLTPGAYELILEASLNGRTEKVERNVFIRKPEQTLNFIFADVEQEAKIMKYFVPISYFRGWADLTLDAKKRMIDKFWRSYAAEKSMSVDDLLSMMKDRIGYTNKYFSSFKAGWESDRGRIYLRRGAPSSTEKKVTGADTRYVQKDFVIWRYEGNTEATYVFLDKVTNGDYKLVYVKNDDKERSDSQWKRYLGDAYEEDDQEDKIGDDSN